MSKRNRNSDNSKRQQPIQQQRAQARQNLPGTARKTEDRKPQSDTDRPQGQQPG